MQKVSLDPSSGFCATTASALAALVAAVAATAIATAAAVATISGAGAGSSLATAIFIAAVLAAAGSVLLAACIAGPSGPSSTGIPGQIVLPLTTVKDGLKTFVHVTKSRPPRSSRRRPPSRKRHIPEESRPTPPPPPAKTLTPSQTQAFHERCGRILQTCDLLVRHFPGTRTLCILRTAQGIIARRPHHAVEPEPTGESDVDVDLDPVLSAPNLSEALRRLDQSIRSAKKYKERNGPLQSTSLVLEAEKRRAIRSSEEYRYLFDDAVTPVIRSDRMPPSSTVNEEIRVGVEYIPRPKVRSSVFQPSHPANTDSPRHLPSPEQTKTVLEDASVSVCDIESFISSQNDFSSSFVEMNSEHIPTSESVTYTDSSVLTESDISSSSFIKDIENVALSSTLTENKQISSSSAEVQLENEALPPIMTEKEAVLFPFNIENESPPLSPVSSSSVTTIETGAPPSPFTLLLAEDISLSSDIVDLTSTSSSNALTETDAIPTSCVLVETEDVSLSSTKSKTISSSVSIVTKDVTSFFTEAEDVSLSSIISETEDDLPSTEIASSYGMLTENNSSDRLAENVFHSDPSTEKETVSPSKLKTESVAFIPDLLNDVPSAETKRATADEQSFSESELSAEFLVNSDSTGKLMKFRIDSIAETANPPNESEEKSGTDISYPRGVSTTINHEEISPIPAPLNLKSKNLTPNLYLTDIVPMKIDQEFEKLIENILPPTEDIDKTFSTEAVCSHISALDEAGLDDTLGRTHMILPLGQSKPEDPKEDGRLSSQAKEVLMNHTISEIQISDSKSFPDLDVLRTLQEGSDYVDESDFKAECLLDTNNGKQEGCRNERQDALIQFITSTNLAHDSEPVEVCFVLSTVPEAKTERNDVCEETNGSAVQTVQLRSDSLSESETNFDREVQSFIKDNLGAEAISDCASDSSSMSVSPNPDISFFRTESNSATASCDIPPENTQQNAKKIEVNKMDGFGFGEPLIVVTARKARTYLDDAEMFQTRLQMKKRRLRAHREDFDADIADVPETKPVITGTIRPKNLETSHRFKPVYGEPCSGDTNICEPLKSEALRPLATSDSKPEDPCSDALPGHFFRSLERRDGRRLTYDHSSEFPVTMRVPHRRAFWDNKLTEPKSESSGQPSIKVTGIVEKCKRTLQTLSAGSSDSLSTMTTDDEDFPWNHTRRFQKAKCFFQNLEGKGEARAVTLPEPTKPESKALGDPRDKFPASLEERFNVTAIYRDVLGDGAAKTAAGAPLRGVPRRKAVVATLDSFRK